MSVALKMLREKAAEVLVMAQAAHALIGTIRSENLLTHAECVLAEATLLEQEQSKGES